MFEPSTRDSLRCCSGGYNYDLATNATRPHAVLDTTVLMPDPTPDVVTACAYDLNGAMVTRNGTGLTYDSQQRLKTYGGTASPQQRRFRHDVSVPAPGCGHIGHCGGVGCNANTFRRFGYASVPMQVGGG